LGEPFLLASNMAFAIGDVVEAVSVGAGGGGGCGAGGGSEAAGGGDGGGDGTASPVSMVLGFANTYKTPSNPTGMSQAMVAF